VNDIYQVFNATTTHESENYDNTSDDDKDEDFNTSATQTNNTNVKKGCNI
jgi:hypothetical protein